MGMSGPSVWKLRGLAILCRALGLQASAYLHRYWEYIGQDGRHGVFIIDTPK